MRHLNSQLKALMESPISAAKVTDPTLAMILAAQSLVGINEVDNPSVVNLIRSTVTTPWGEPWCADFVQSCIGYAETVTGKLSPIPATEGVLDLWNKAKATCAVHDPRAGDIIIWQVAGSLSEGHCGIITGSDSILWATIEGNTSNPALGAGTVEAERNGHGVYAKRRAKGGTRTFIEVGFLRCFT